MTAIAGLVAPDHSVWIGGDSAGVCGYSLTVRSDEKVFRNGPFLFGFTSSFRMGQLLRYKLQTPRYCVGDDIDKYMVTDFVDSVRNCLKGGGYARKENEKESAGTFLVGFRGRLFKIDGDYQVGESKDGYDACGSGDDTLVGSLYSTRGTEPEQRIRMALEAAQQHNSCVRGPFVIQSLSMEPTE